jgi:hypothetical protein
MMSKIWKKTALLGACCALLHTPNVWADESDSYTYSSFQMNENALKLDLEIHPHLLQQARVLRDLDGDGQMSQLEFDESKAAILQYVQQKIGIVLNERILRADSAAITFRFENSSPVPNRIEVTCRYALLLKPAHLLLRNEMFQELSERSRNYGVLSDGAKTVDFEFRATSRKISTPVAIEFSSTRDWQLLQNDADAVNPTVFWGIAGGSGLLVLAVAARVRKTLQHRTRHQRRKRRSPSIATAKEHLKYEHVLN